MTNIKVLITDDNSNEILSLASALRENKTSIKICPKDGNAILECFYKFEPDVVIIDSLLDTLDTKGVVSRIKETYCGKSPFIIVMSCFCSDYFNDEMFSAGVNIIHKKPIVPQTVVNDIFLKFKFGRNIAVPRYVFDSNSVDINELENAIIEIMNDVGFSSKYIGYTYLKECVFLTVRNPEYSRFLSKNLYPKIAEKHNVSMSSVEKNIRVAIDSAFSKKDLSRYFYYFSYNKQKPTNAEAINTLAQHVKMKKSLPVSSECYKNAFCY